MKHILTIVVLIVVSSTGYTQCTFHKLYDRLERNDAARAVIESSDGTYVTCGQTTSSPYGGLFIVKTAACGDTIWTRDIDFTASGDAGNSIIETFNGNYAICGFLKNVPEGATDGYLYIISTDGDSLGLQSYNAGYNDRCQELLQTPDSGFIMAGFRNAYEDSSLYVIKTDKLGGQEWIQYYGGTGWDKVFDIQLTEDGGFVISGERGNAATSTFDLFLMKADSLGNQEWYQYYNSQAGADDGYGHVILTNDNGYLVSGTKETSPGSGVGQAWLIKTDSIGDIEWETDWNLPYDYAYLFDMDHTPDGNYLVSAGVRKSVGPVTGPQVLLAKFDNNGDTLWTRKYSYLGGPHHTYTNDMHVTNDGGAILSGYTINLTTAENDFWMLKVDSMGNVCTVVDSVLGCSATGCSFVSAAFSIADTLWLADADSINLSGPSNVDTWAWDFGSLGTSQQQNPTVSFDTAGTYVISLVVAVDTLCSDSVAHSIVVLDDVGVPEETASSYGLINYPNPFTEGTMIEVNISGTDACELLVYNLVGTVQQRYALQSGHNSIEIVKDDLKAGIYFYTLYIDNQQVETKKMVRLE